MRALEFDTPWEADPVNGIIEAAAFDKKDLDMGTGGFCGTFALALHRKLREQGIPADLYLLCIVDTYCWGTMHEGGATSEHLK